MPLMVISPAVFFSRSAMTRRNVVLPQPEGPMKETKSPFSTERLTPVSAVNGPSAVWKVRPRSFAETTVSDGDMQLIFRRLAQRGFRQTACPYSALQSALSAVSLQERKSPARAGKREDGGEKAGWVSDA